MTNVLIIASLLALVHQSLTSPTTCPNLKSFSETFIPNCMGKDENVLWPNYENFSQFYLCLGQGKSQLEDCPYNSYFSFNLQLCTKCKDFVPPPKCSLLPTQSGKPVCAAITPTKTTITPPAICMEVEDTVYKTKYEPACIGNDVYRLWPNYEDLQKYYMCKAEYKPVIESCPSNTYFNFYAQGCTSCDKFFAAPACEKLNPQGTPKCVKI